MAEAWTIRRILSWAAEDFLARGFDSPRLDAELLLCHAIGLDRVGLIVHSERTLDEQELARMRELIQRRRRAEPVAYILGEREFYGLSFRVDARVLIPRPDTETLVEVALRHTRDINEFGHALDVCTGSGCVAIAFAKHRPTWKVTASDYSENALAMAKHNAERLGTAWGMRFIQGDLFSALEPDARFALITINPPYIPSSDVPGLDAGISDHEPHLALDGGPDGLSLIRRSVQEAPRHLLPGAYLAMEIGSDQGARVQELFSAAGFVSVTCDQDATGHDRVVSGRMPA